MWVDPDHECLPAVLGDAVELRAPPPSDTILFDSPAVEFIPRISVESMCWFPLRSRCMVLVVLA